MKFRIMVTSGVKGRTLEGGDYQKVHKVLSVIFYFLNCAVAARMFIKLFTMLLQYIGGISFQNEIKCKK